MQWQSHRPAAFQLQVGGVAAYTESLLLYLYIPVIFITLSKNYELLHLQIYSVTDVILLALNFEALNFETKCNSNSYSIAQKGTS